jgi:hypothetical protein
MHHRPFGKMGFKKALRTFYRINDPHHNDTPLLIEKIASNDLE